MLMIQHNNGRQIPIIMEKLDFSPICIMSDIIHGEFRRNSKITHENLNKAIDFIKTYNTYTEIPEKELNKIIKKSLRILYYGKKG